MERNNIILTTIASVTSVAATIFFVLRGETRATSEGAGGKAEAFIN